jgi:hypothetical protein
MSETRNMIMVASLERHLFKERNVLFEAIMAQQCVPTGLPYPAVSANYLWKLNQLALNDADYVFLLVGNEYGPLTEQGVGYLHQTYATVRAQHKIPIALVYTGTAKTSPSDIDRTRLNQLVGLLMTSLCYQWDSEETLRDVAERAIEQVRETHPADGWQRRLTEAEPTAQLSALRAENERLKQELAAGRSNRVAADHSALTNPTSVWHSQFTCKAFREGQLKVLTGSASVSWKTVFTWLAAPLLSPVTETKVKALLADYLQPLALIYIKRRWHGSHAVADVKLERAALDELKLQLHSMALIRFDNLGRWSLTEAGESVELKTVPARASRREA